MTAEQEKRVKEVRSLAATHVKVAGVRLNAAEKVYAKAKLELEAALYEYGLANREWGDAVELQNRIVRGEE